MHNRLLRALMLMVWMAFLPCAFGQTVAPNPSQGSNVSGPFNPLTSLQFLLCIVSVAFGLIVLTGQFFLLRRVNGITPDDIAKNCAISIVIVGAIILVIAGYDSQQNAQAFGLFGTIIGYLLGRSAGKRDEQQKEAGS